MTRAYTQARNVLVRMLVVFACCLLGSEAVYAQCVPISDPRRGGVSTYRPLKRFRCLTSSGNPTTTFLLNWAGPASNMTIDWGDGTIETVPGPLTSRTHTYTTTGTFRYRVTYAGCTSDTVKGDYTNDFNTTVPGIGFITPPAGFTNKRCVPEALTIINASPNMNGFTEFIVDWGDLKKDTIDYTSYLQGITHNYLPATTGCNVKISVLYRNVCGATPGGLAPSAVYGEYYFMDRDSARVNPASIIVCAPTDVTINDVSKLNCLDSLNREIRWAATQGFGAPLPFPGNGVWRPYGGGGTRTMNIPASAFYPIPADSIYRLKMTIRNQCGPDSTYAQIRIVAPRKPVFAVLNDNVCPGTPMNFRNTTPDPLGVQSYFWIWGDGQQESNNGGTVSHTFDIGGQYWVKLYTIVNGYNGQRCQKVDSIRVNVQRTVTPIINVTPLQGCDTLTVRVQNRSVNTQTVVWKGWDLGGNPTITAGSGILPGVSSDPTRAQVVSTSMADTSAIIRYFQYGRYTIRLKAQSVGCPENNDFQRVYIYPTPKVRFRIPDRRICFGQTLTVRDSSRVIPTDSRGLNADWNTIRYQLDMGDGTIYGAGQSITGNFDSPGLSNRLTLHNYAAPGTYMVRIRVRTPYSCQAVDSIRVVVQPVVTPSFTVRQDVCDPSRITIRNTSSRDTAKFEFTVRRAGVFYTRITRYIKDSVLVTLPYTGPADTTYYQITLRGVTGVPGDTCSVGTAPTTVKVIPAAVALFSVSQADGCTPLNGVQFFNNSYNIPTGGNYTLLWNFGNGNSFFGDNPPLQSYLNSSAVNRRDTARLTLVSPQGCRFRYQREIITYPAPNVQIIAPDSICAGGQITFSATGNGLATYTWRFADLDGTVSGLQNPVRSFPNTGFVPRTYTVVLDVRTASGCFATASKVITVFPPPVAGFTALPSELCGNAPATLSVDANNGSNGARYYFWDFGDGQNTGQDSTSPTATHGYPANTGVTSILYNVVLRVRSAQGCVSAPYSRTITLRPAVRAIFSADTNRICAPGTVNFANIGYRSGVAYTWFVKTEGSPGNGAPFGANTGVGGFRYTFTNPSNLSQVRYVVALVAQGTSGFPVCEDTLRDTITVYGVPQANYSLISQTPASGCSPLAVLARPDSSALINRYTWTFGDTASNRTNTTPADVLHIYTNYSNAERTYTLTLTAATQYNCVATQSQDIRVKPVPRAAFRITDSIGCGPLSVGIINRSSPAADNFTWLVDGVAYNFDRNPLPFRLAGLSSTDTTRYVIRLVARGIGNACPDTSAPRLVLVLPQPRLTLAATPLAGCSPLIVGLNLAGSTGVGQVIWQRRLATATTWTNFDTTAGLSLSSTRLTNTGSADITYQVRAITIGTSGCSDTARAQVVVSPEIVADFIALPDTVGCGPFQVTFRNRTQSPAANAFLWTINGVSTSASPTDFSYLFQNPSSTRDTVYNVEFQAANQTTGCPSIKRIRIRVKPVPVLGLAVALTPPSACSPVRARYTITGAAGAAGYTWLFATGDTVRTTQDTAQVRNYTNTGLLPATRTIRVVAASAYGCQAAVDRPITINPLVRASLIQSGPGGCSPQGITFTNTSTTGADVLEWVVDGLGRANGQVFSYVFTNTDSLPRTYRIKLIASNSSSPACADTAYGTVVVQPTPLLTSLSASPLAGCSPLQVDFVAAGDRIRTYRWNFADGNQFDTAAAAVGHQFFNTTGIQPRIFDVSVIAMNASGCTDTLTKAIAVRPGSRAIISTADTLGCTPLRSQFIGSGSQNANLFEWTWGDGLPPAYMPNPVHTFANDSDTVRTYTVRLTASRAGGFCPDTTYRTVRVLPIPRVAFTPGDTQACQPVAVAYRSQVIGGDSLRWTITSTEGIQTRLGISGFDTVYTNQNPTVSVVTVSLQATNMLGCSAEETHLVRVGPLAEAAITASIDSGCSPLRVRFANQSTPGTVITWLINDNPVSQAPSGFSYTFTNYTDRDTVIAVRGVVYNPTFGRCQDTATVYITVYPRPDAGTLFASPASGCSPLLVELNGSATGAAYYSWDLRDGTQFDTVSQTISHVFVNNSLTVNQLFRVRQIAISQHGCRDTASATVLVRPGVLADFTVSDSAGCTPLSVQFNSGGTYNANLYTWDFGDGIGGSNNRNPFYRFDNDADTARTYTITLQADKAGVGCPSVAQRNVTVYPKPHALFTPADTSGCQPLAIRYQSQAEAADSVSWAFASGSDFVQIGGRSLVDTVYQNLSSAIAEVRVTLTAYNRFGCEDNVGHKTRISPLTVAAFDIPEDSACSPFRLQASNLSSSGSVVQWFVGGTPVAPIRGALSTVLYNYSDRDSTVEVMLVATNRLSPGCRDTVRQNVVVLAKPRANSLFASPDAGCSPLLVELNGAATGATYYRWNMGDGVQFDTVSQTVSHLFANLSTSLPRTFRVQFVAINAFGCADTALQQITVRPNVRAGITAAITEGCSPLGVQLSSAPSINANTFNWDFGDGTAGSSSADPFHQFENLSDTVRTFTVTLLADKVGIGCPDLDTIQIRVYPRPLAAFTPGDTMGCQPFALLARSRALRADSLVWTLTQGTFSRVYINQPLVDTLLGNLTADIQENTLSLLAINRYGCQDLVERRIRVNPLVAAAITASADSGCTPLPVTFSNISAEGNRVRWFVNGQLVSQNPVSFSYTFLNSTQRDTAFEVMLVATSRYDAACVDTVRKQIRVFGRPDAGVLFASPESGCSPLLVELNGAATGAIRYRWSFDDGTAFDTTSQQVSHVFVSTRLNTDRLFRTWMAAINEHGCADTAYQDITVKPGVVAAFSVSDSTGCAPLGISFSNQSQNANLYQWDFGDGTGPAFQSSPYRVFDNRSDTVQTYLVTLQADKNGVGCPSITQRTIRIYPRPVADFIPEDTAGCQPFAVRFSARPRLAQNWFWTFTSAAGDVTTAGQVQDIDSVFANQTAQSASTQIRIDVESQYGCRASRIKTIRAYPLIAAAFAPDRDSGCSPLRVRFANNSAQGNQFSWYVQGDYAGNASQTLDYTFVNQSGRDSVFNITLIARHPGAPGCVDSIRRQVRVFAKPIAGLITPQPESGCSPLQVAFTGTAQGAVRYAWTFGDGTSADTSIQQIGHLYINQLPVQQTFAVQQVAVSIHGCADTTFNSVVVRPQVEAFITLADTAGCSPFTLQATGVGSRNANRYGWDYGDGSGLALGQNVVHIYRNQSDTTQRFRIRLVADKLNVGCPDTAYAYISVYPEPRLAITPSVTEGCSPMALRLTNGSTGQGIRTLYIFNDGGRLDSLYTDRLTIDTVLLNTGTQRKTVWIETQVVSRYGCQVQSRQPIFINPGLTARFDSLTPGCAPHTVRLVNRSQNPDLNYIWDFGDGTPTSTDISPQHVFRYSGPRDTTYVVTLRSLGNPSFMPQCEAVVTRNVVVHGQPAAGFAFLPDNQVILPNNQITIQNTTPSRSAFTYRWSFGDGTTDTTAAGQFTHVLAGLFQALTDTALQVRMVVTGPTGCTDSVTKPLYIRPIKPEADFDPDTAGCAPVDVVFRNKSKWANQYYWQFGDGSTSTEQNPSHRYTRPGTYTVRLIVFGPGGSDTLERTDIINVYDVPDPTFTIYPKAPRKLRIPEDELVGIVRDPKPGYTYLWEFGDGGTSTAQEPRYRYQSPGTYSITLTITSENGCVASDTAASAAEVENGGYIQIPNAFTPSSAGPSGGNLNGAEGYNDIFYPVTEGVVDIRLEIYNRWGEMIYLSTTLNKGWDGYFQGRLCPLDTYVYKVTAKFGDGRIKRYVGDVTLVR